MTQYSIAIEKNHGDYYPIHWQLTPLYEANLANKPDGQNISRHPSLEEIDRYTSFYEEEAFMEELVKTGAIQEEEAAYAPVIIFVDNKTRKLDDGILYENEKESIEPEFIENFIIENKDNSNLLNRLYTKYYKSDDKSLLFTELLYIIKNIKRYRFNQLVIGLTRIKELPYIERRNLGLFINRQLKKNIIVEEIDEAGLKLKKDL